MGLKQIQENRRIIFLKKFTAELILNSMKEQERNKRIAVEKIKQRFLPGTKEEKETRLEEYQKSMLDTREQIPQTQQLQPITPERLTIRQPRSAREITEITEKKETIYQPAPLRQPKEIAQEQGVRRYNVTADIEGKTTQEIRTKIQELLKDPAVHMVECPGPEKNLLVKRYNRILVTRVTLTQKEITNIIADFSRKARIPLVRGILKAAVGNLVISAVTSEYVGSRFIMNKMTPYSFIE